MATTTTTKRPKLPPPTVGAAPWTHAILLACGHAIGARSGGYHVSEEIACNACSLECKPFAIWWTRVTGILPLS